MAGLCAGICAGCRAGQHVAAWLRSRTRTRRVVETGISCHHNSLTYLCHLNALHSEVGRFKKTRRAPPPSRPFRHNLNLSLKGFFYYFGGSQGRDDIPGARQWHVALRSEHTGAHAEHSAVPPLCTLCHPGPALLLRTPTALCWLQQG